MAKVTNRIAKRPSFEEAPWQSACLRPPGRPSAGWGPFLLPLWASVLGTLPHWWLTCPKHFCLWIFFSRMPSRFHFVIFIHPSRPHLKPTSSVRPPQTPGSGLISFLQILPSSLHASFMQQSFVGVWHLLFPCTCPVSASGRERTEAPFGWGRCLSHLSILIRA